ncbi:MAG: hypothetical protein IH991_07300, partial [Planctomycetes bacterium]|nr:hypothetical protein [Planctomycetota bacterium]
MLSKTLIVFAFPILLSLLGDNVFGKVVQIRVTPANLRGHFKELISVAVTKQDGNIRFTVTKKVMKKPPRYTGVRIVGSVHIDKGKDGIVKRDVRPKQTNGKPSFTFDISPKEIPGSEFVLFETFGVVLKGVKGAVIPTGDMYRFALDAFYPQDQVGDGKPGEAVPPLDLG